MKVLIADDDVVTRRLLEATLKSWSYEVCSATDGAEALRILEGGARPDIALLDWQMPEKDGPEVCRIIRARPQTLPVYLILLTTLGGRARPRHGPGVCLRRMRAARSGLIAARRGGLDG